MPDARGRYPDRRTAHSAATDHQGSAEGRPAEALLYTVTFPICHHGVRTSRISTGRDQAGRGLKNEPAGGGTDRAGGLWTNRLRSVRTWP